MPLPPPSLLPEDVRRWIDGQDAAERDALARTWDLVALADAPQPVATDEAWARLDALLDDAPARPADDDRPTADAVQTGLRAWQDRARPELAAVPTSLLARPAVWGSAVAAALVGFVALGLWWVQPVTVSAPGSVVAVALPDGSTVALAPGAELAYARGLRGDVRRVELTGQGYFDVAHDGRPFVVETPNAGVEVLGTEFDVQARGGETIVVLVDGSVRLRSAGGAVVLRPGETSRVADGAPTAPAPVAPGLVVAWRDGAFSVDDVPLGAVAEAIGARFGRPVRLAPGVDADRRLTLFLPTADSADVVLRDLAAYLDLRLQVSADRYELLPR